MIKVSIISKRRALSAFCALVAVSHAASVVAEAPLVKSCIEHGEHQGAVFFLVDRSDKMPSIESLRQTLISVKEIVKPGERLVVGTSTGKKSDTHIIFDMVRPKADVWASALKIRAQEKKFTDCFLAAQTTVLEQNEDSPTSAIVETLTFVADVLNAETSGEKRLVIFSDMIQHSELLNFYSTKTIDVDGSLAKLNKAGLIVRLSGVAVSIAGAGAGVSDEKARVIEAFWRKYFEKSAATLKFYGPLLLGDS
jgi:hypothetical protein